MHSCDAYCRVELITVIIAVFFFLFAPHIFAGVGYMQALAWCVCSLITYIVLLTWTHGGLQSDWS